MGVGFVVELSSDLRRNNKCNREEGIHLNDRNCVRWDDNQGGKKIKTNKGEENSEKASVLCLGCYPTRAWYRVEAESCGRVVDGG